MAFWGHLGPFGGHLGAIWGLPGAIWGHLKPSRSWPFFRCLLRCLFVAFWGLLGPFGAIWGPPRFFWAFWGLLNAFEVPFGALWGLVGPSGGHLGACWCPNFTGFGAGQIFRSLFWCLPVAFWGLLGPSGGYLGPF